MPAKKTTKKAEIEKVQQDNTVSDAALERKKRFLAEKEKAGGIDKLVQTHKEKPWVIYFTKAGEIVCFTQNDVDVKDDWETYDFSQEQLKILIDNMDDLFKYRINVDPTVDNLYSIQLKEINTDELKIPAMNRGLMLTYKHKEDHVNAAKFAAIVLQNEQLSRAHKEEATMIQANANYALGNTIEAQGLYAKVVAISTDVDRAEAGYRLCEITYLDGQYKQAEAEIFAYLKQKPSYDYWLAKGYILLADTYVKLDDNFQAKATLQSVIDYYKGTDEIKSIAESKLAAIIAAEDAKDNQDEEELEINMIEKP